MPAAAAAVAPTAEQLNAALQAGGDPRRVLWVGPEKAHRRWRSWAVRTTEAVPNNSPRAHTMEHKHGLLSINCNNMILVQPNGCAILNWTS